MDPKKPETNEQRIFAAELEIKHLLDEFKIFNTAMCQDIDEVRQEGKETRLIVDGMKTDIALMPNKIIEAMKNDAKAKKFEARDWMFLFVAIVSAAGTIGALIK